MLVTTTPTLTLKAETDGTDGSRERTLRATAAPHGAISRGPSGTALTWRRGGTTRGDEGDETGAGHAPSPSRRQNCRAPGDEGGSAAPALAPASSSNPRLSARWPLLAAAARGDTNAPLQSCWCENLFSFHPCGVRLLFQALAC